MSETVETDNHPWPNLSGNFSFKCFKVNSVIKFCKLCEPKSVAISAFIANIQPVKVSLKLPFDVF